MTTSAGARPSIDAERAAPARHPRHRRDLYKTPHTTHRKAGDRDPAGFTTLQLHWFLDDCTGQVWHDAGQGPRRLEAYIQARNLELTGDAALPQRSAIRATQPFGYAIPKRAD